MEALPPVRRVLRSRRVEPVVATVLRGSPVRRLGQFLMRELRPPDVAAPYRLREAGAIVFVRHRTPDVAALGEVFYERQYEPPSAVAERIAAAQPPLRVLDLGANIGMFGVFAMHRYPGAELTAIEPDRANLVLLEQTMAANGWQWTVVAAAAAAADGEVRFASGDFTTSRIDPAGAPVRAVDALPLLRESDFAKIDIEGGEWAILGDPRFSTHGSPALVIEYHPHLCPSDDPHEEARSRLTEADYSLEEARSFANGHGLLWAWR
jgi:FkbM family methyltransferase